jgi:hypothetical protein
VTQCRPIGIDERGHLDGSEQQPMIRTPFKIMAWIIAGLAVFAIIGTLTREPPAPKPASRSSLESSMDQAALRRQQAIAEHQAFVDALRVTNVRWRLDGFGTVLVASFTVRNEGKRNMKDLQVACDIYSNSGTRIGSATATIYEWLDAGKTRTFKEMNLGFVHVQSAKMGCQVIEAAEL